jgi:hypothetical protein
VLAAFVVAANALADRPIVDCAFPKVDPGTALTNEMISDTVTRAQTCILDFEHGYYSMNVGDAG